MKEILQTLFNQVFLTEKAAYNALLEIGNGNCNDAQIAAFLTAYNMRHPNANEMIGFRKAMLEMAIPVQLNYNQTLDIVGTGGDGKDTFNISTLASFVCAGAGIKVTKHGNYGVSSVSGSSNVLEFLGVKFTSDISKIQKQLDAANITFLHAPLFHTSMKHVANVRKQLQVKTIFNLLGPIVNPSKPTHLLAGVCDGHTGELYKQVLTKSGMQFSVVHSMDGYDEVSLTGDTKLFSTARTQTLAPTSFNLQKLKQEDIYGGNTVESNAKIFLNILKGKGTDAQNSVVIANAGLAISMIENNSLFAGVEIAKENLLNGNALKSFEKLKSI